MGTKDRRQEYPYRKEYIKHHRRRFCGDVYRCSICFKKLSEDEMEVDHIFALNKFGPNHLINCTSCCHDCNHDKADTLDSRTYKQVAYKVLEEISIGLSIFVIFIFNIIKSLFKVCMDNIDKPDIKKPNIKVNFKVVCIAIIVAIILFYYWRGRGSI